MRSTQNDPTGTETREPARLEEAARLYRRPGTRPAAAWSSCWIPLTLLAILTAAAVGLGIPTLHRFTLSFTFAEAPDPDAQAALDQAVRDGIVTLRASSPDTIHSWRCEVSGCQMRLNVFTTTRDQGAQAQTKLPRLVLEAYPSSSPPPAVTPAPDPLHETQRLQDARRRRDAARHEADDMQVRISSDDPRSRHAASRRKLEDLLQRCERAGQDCLTREREWEALQAVDPAAGAVVTDEDRTKALAADTPLRQDMAQLDVAVSDIRKACLALRQETAALIEELHRASVTWRDRADELRRVDTLTRVRADLDAVYQAVSAYVARLEAFRVDSTEQHSILQAAQGPDKVFEALTRVEQMAKTFFFEGGQRIEDATAALQKLRESVGLGAALQTALSEMHKHRSITGNHHADLEARLRRQRPVRLDAAIEAAQRLESRIRERMAVLEKQLRDQASQRAAEQHAIRLLEAQEALNRARQSLLETSAGLVPLTAEVLRSEAEVLEHDRLLRAAQAAEEEARRWDKEILALEAQLAEGLIRPTDRPRAMPTVAVLHPLAEDTPPRTRVFLAGLVFAGILLGGVLAARAASTRRTA